MLLDGRQDGSKVLKGTKHFPDSLCSFPQEKIKQKFILNEIFYALLSVLYSSGHTVKKNILYVYNSDTY
jgi:hypothetical protein